LINNEGKIILDKNLSATTTKIEIDVRDIAAGIYHFVYLKEQIKSLERLL